MIISIDPGVSGAIVLLTEFGGYTAHIPMPTIKIGSSTRVNGAAVAAFLNSNIYGLTHCYIEKVHSMPKQGVSSTFTFGHAAGVVEGVVAGLGVPNTLVPPATWKKHIGLIGSEKDAARSRAVQLYPDLRALDAKIKGQALADAIFIGLCGLGIKEPKRSLI